MPVTRVPYRQFAIGLVAFASPALAQEASPSAAAPAQTRQPQQSPPTIAAPSTTAVDPANPPGDVAAGADAGTTDAPAAGAPSPEIAAMIAEAAKFAKFDRWRAQGQTSDLPGTYDSLFKDTGGWRTWLYDHNFYVKGQDLVSVTEDLNGGKSPTDPQVFNGQKFTVFNDFEARVGYVFHDDGTDIGQINTSVHFVRVNWDQTGPNYLGVDRLDVYRSFFGRRVEVTAGIGANIVNYLGIFSGGNLLLANGLAATIPIEVGLSGGNAVTPLLNIQLNLKGGFYSKSGIQRSIGPAGAIEEAKHNDGGLSFSQPGAKALFIQEFGLQRPASADARQLWLRAGGIYNTTNYQRLDGRGAQNNWAVYALGDYQLFQPSRQQAYRGVFVGGSALVAPDALNVFKQTYEARVYAIGMLPGRPTDALNFTVDYNRFSRTGGQTYSLLGFVTQKYQLSAGVLYAVHATRGLYFTPSLTYIEHPSFTGTFKPAVNLSTTLTMLF